MLQIKRDNAGSEIAAIGEKTAVLFHAKWCPFCRKFKPVFESYEGKDNIKMAELDVVDEEGETWDAFRFEVIPTVIVFSNGKELARRNGRAGIGLLEDDLKSLLKEVSGKA